MKASIYGLLRITSVHSTVLRPSSKNDREREYVMKMVNAKDPINKGDRKIEVKTGKGIRPEKWQRREDWSEDK